MKHTKKSDVFADICCLEKRGVTPELLESILYLAVELAREGREGRKVGTIFVVGDTSQVLEMSRPLILDPLFGHPDDKKRIQDADMRESVKELSQLDGAFVISPDGVVVSAARYIDVSSRGVSVSLGLGSRHMAAASITKATQAVAIVVSESAMVRVYDNGELISEILPEIWLMQQYGARFPEEKTRQRSADNLIVITKEQAAA